MRPTTDLAKLREAANGRLRRIRSATASLPGLAPSEAARTVAFAVIELDNLVLSSLREFTISTLRRARTASGQRVQVNAHFGSAEAVGAYVLSVVEVVSFQRLGSPQAIDRRKEVKLRDPRLVERVLRHCNASNIQSFQTALSLNSSMFRDISSVRNFYAHRNEDTWKKVRNIAQSRGILNPVHPDELMGHRLLPRPVTVLEDWMDDAELFIHEMTV